MLDRFFNKISPQRRQLLSEIDALKKEMEETKCLLGRIAAEVCTQKGISESEFKVYSQFGEDGIIQYLLKHVKINKKIFIEFGVETYSEANTRFLLLKDNWKGMVIDGSKEHMDFLKSQEMYWQHELTAVAQFITADNINDIFKQNGFTGEIGILSIDIDGNDYWVWDKIDTVDPAIVVAEYNSTFGSKHAITIPCIPDFYRTNYHHSNLYWGCSLKALNVLAEKKGYALVGCNAAGNNCFFVKKNLLPSNIRQLSVEEAYVESKFRESRDISGNLTYVTGKARLEAIGEMQVIDVERNEKVKIKDLK
ncbi:MAG: hypothetical protein NT150_06505 [Bacteroidetes bacterium]|nr:hypothetical protein [Bacteroidota bacterium]